MSLCCIPDLVADVRAIEAQLRHHLFYHQIHFHPYGYGISSSRSKNEHVPNSVVCEMRVVVSVTSVHNVSVKNNEFVYTVADCSALTLWKAITNFSQKLTNITKTRIAFTLVAIILRN